MFFFKHETAYEMRISDWSSDVCSSDLAACPSSAVLSRCVLGHRLLAQREIDDLSEVQCVAAAALADLLATRKAIGDDHGRVICRPDCRQQRLLGDRLRPFVAARATSETAGHAAAAGVAPVDRRIQALQLLFPLLDIYTRGMVAKSPHHH